MICLQIWNVFGENKNYECGIWGVMNAPLGGDIGIKFFAFYRAR